MYKDFKNSILLDYYGGLLTEKQSDMLNLYYNQDLSLSEIAENEGISRQGVYDAVKRAEEQLAFFEEKLGYVRAASLFEHFVGEAENTVAAFKENKVNAESALEKISFIIKEYRNQQ